MRDIQENNIKYSMQAMYAAKQMGCKVFVETGSQAEYGIISTKISESTPCAPFSDYGKAKLSLFKKASAYSSVIGIKYLHLRLFSVYGENDHPWSMISSCASKMMKNEDVELSDCSHKWNFLYVRDCAKQIVKLSEWAMYEMHSPYEVFNIASDDTRILRSFIEEMYELTCSSSRLLYGKIKPINTVSLDPDISKLKQTIGYVSEISFNQGFMNIINKYKHG